MGARLTGRKATQRCKKVSEEGFWGRVLRRVLRRGYGLTVQKCSEKGSQERAKFGMDCQTDTKPMVATSSSGLLLAQSLAITFTCLRMIKEIREAAEWSQTDG